MHSYRRARSIVLYDASVIINNCINGVSCVHPFHTDSFNDIEISGFEIVDLAQALGVQTHPIKTGSQLIPLGDRNFKFERVIYNYGNQLSGGKIVDLFARVDGPHMLSIRIIEAWVEKRETIEIFYSGCFSIEWEEKEQMV